MIQGRRRRRSHHYSDNIIPTMTSSTAPSGVASAVSILDEGYGAWNAFDHQNPAYVCWLSSWTPSGWLQYQFPAAHVVTRYAVTSRNPSGTDTASPKTWTFKGSSNGTDWTTLDTQTNVTDWAETGGVRKVFDFANTSGYAYYRLDITASNYASYVGVGELEMMTAVTW